MHIEGGHSHILYLTASCERSTYIRILAHEGRLRRRSRRWSEEWRPAAAARNRSPLGLGTRPPATIRPGCEECAGTDPDVQSGEGKAPARPKIATVECREASVSERRGRLTRALGAPQGALRGCRSTRTLSRRSATPHFGCAKPKAKPMRKKRAAATKKYVLFDK